MCCGVVRTERRIRECVRGYRNRREYEPERRYGGYCQRQRYMVAQCVVNAGRKIQQPGRQNGARSGRHGVRQWREEVIGVATETRHDVGKVKNQVGQAIITRNGVTNSAAGNEPATRVGNAQRSMVQRMSGICVNRCAANGWSNVNSGR